MCNPTGKLIYCKIYLSISLLYLFIISFQLRFHICLRIFYISFLFLQLILQWKIKCYKLKQIYWRIYKYKKIMIALGFFANFFFFTWALMIKLFHTMAQAKVGGNFFHLKQYHIIEWRMNVCFVGMMERWRRIKRM